MSQEKPKVREAAWPTPKWRHAVFMVLSMLCIMGVVASEGCTKPAPGETNQETTKSEPGQDTTEVAARPEPTTEAKAEPTLDAEPATDAKKAEPGQEPGTPEPADAGGGEMLADADPKDAGPSGPCTGITPPYPDAGGGELPPDIPVPDDASPDDGCKYKPGQCIGSSVPAWKLEDFQPQSCGYKKSYNLKAFTGHVVVVALLSGW